MEALSQVCDSHLLKYVDFNSSINPREYVKILKEMAVPFDEMFHNCHWRYNYLECSDLFTEVITEEGICYTFNMVDGNELFRTDVIDSDFYSLYHKMSSTSWIETHGGMPGKNISGLARNPLVALLETY